MYCQSFVVLCAVVSLQLHLIPALVLGQPLQNLLSPFGSGLNAGGLLNSGAGIIAGGGVLPGSGLSGYGSVCNLQPNVASFLYGQLNRQLGFQSNFPYIQPNQYRILGLAPSLSSPNSYMSPIQLSNGNCQGLELRFDQGVSAGPFCSINSVQPISCGLIQPSSYCSESVVLNILPVVVVEAPVVEEPIVEEPIVEEPVVEEPIVEEPIYEEPAVVYVEPEVVEPIAVRSVELEPQASYQQPGCSQNVQVSIVQPVRAAAPAIAAEVPEVVNAPIVKEVESPAVVGIPVSYGPICYPQQKFVSMLYGQLNPLFGLQSSYSYIQPNQYKILGLAPSLNNPNQYMCPIQLSNGACHGLELGVQGGFSAGSYSSISSVLPIQCPSVQAPMCGFSF